MNNLFFLTLAFLTDIILGSVFGGAFVGVGSSATSNVLLITLILISFKSDNKKILVLSFFVGMIFDLFNVDTMLTYASIYFITTLIVSLWTTRINDTFIELFLVTLSAVFLKEFLVYLLNVTFNSYILDIGSWATTHLLFTLLLSLVPITISVFIKLKLIEKELRIQRSSKTSDFINYRY